ncbi:hypothetical protein NK718_00240 [Alsobacter sp. SYSU M60028]|uniref:HPt domain-containing protein n=1 Tax=Alsobacter ponti TaxID=2962936 RepID=A0ABT1L6B8_9HYPH|nr:hypothetical protein [Alsobacter ponti]MCP8936932.1 hypothetical protein [Alsobacter ponti]
MSARSSSPARRSAGPDAPGAAGAAGRLRAVLSHAGLDCECRERLDAALRRFATQETRRAARRALAEARARREDAAAILALLDELDHLTSEETDRSVFLELSLLFHDLAQAATAGADALAELAREE